jgi:DNA-binding NarL/FixJ family response regulator
MIYPLFRGGIRQVIEADHSFSIVGEAEDGELRFAGFPIY